MFNSGIAKFVLTLLLFPMFFQNAFVSFAWGAGDQLWLMIGKRLFLLLPVFAIILGCWVTIGCLITLVFRQDRREFLTVSLITWWDLGKTIVSFWGGVFKFIFNLFAALLGLLRVIVLGIWSVIQEVFFMPLRLIMSVGQNVVSSPIPLIAVFLTVFWCLIEALIFTYVTTPLVVDTFSNITGEQLGINFIRIPLYIFLLFVILGSYAVLSTMVDAFKSKNISTILGIGVIEIIVLSVEVVFLYREFVDSLVPWFAQYSENFELGIFGTMAIACLVWFGIRSLSWFLFASHGTPTIMTVIQGKGIEIPGRGEVSKGRFFEISFEFMNKVKEDTSWIQAKGEELLASIMLPPLQIVAAGVNFCTLLIINNHLFELPFKNMENITNTKVLIDNISNRSLSKGSRRRVQERVQEPVN